MKKLESFKLTEEDKKILLDIGNQTRHFRQIQSATNKGSIFLINQYGERKINYQKAIEILGRTAFLAGVSRAAFHRDCVKLIDDKNEKEYIYFNFKKYFSS